jgi:putative Mg2+ transporter-C (MgtC) family protein
LPDLAWWHIVIRVAVAAGLGGAIGMERELREREAGFRTHLLVSVGSALFTIVSAYGFHDFRYGHGINYDPTRIAAQIVTGIGFIGAGAILRQGLSVRGLTTAATLWVVAAIGMASGAGFYSAAVITTVAVLISLGPLRILAYRALDRPQRRAMAVELRGRSQAAPVLAALEGVGATVDSFQLTESGQERQLELHVELAEGSQPDAALRKLGELDEVRAVRWVR